MEKLKSLTLALRIWISTSLVFGSGWLIYTTIDHTLPLWSSLLATVCSLIGSSPVLIVLTIALPVINKEAISKLQKKLNLILVCAILFLVYGLFTGIISGFTYEYHWLTIAGVVYRYIIRQFAFSDYYVLQTSSIIFFLNMSINIK